MRAPRAVSLVALVGCGNNLPAPGSCEVPTTDEAATVTHVALFGQGASFDDVRFSPQLDKVIVAPQGTGRLYVVEPDTLEVRIAAVPGGSASADADASQIYVADRSADRIIAIDAVTLEQVASGNTDSNPDYVRVAPTVPEIWVTLPGKNRIDILDPRTLTRIGSVLLPIAPEGLTFDANGFAYTQGGSRAVLIDVERRIVIGDYDTGCGSSHGFPQIDAELGLVIAGCSSNGGAAVVTTTGSLRTGIEAGGNAAILAYDDVRHHLYLRGDPGDTLDIIATCADGGMSVLESVSIPRTGHGATADNRGNVWVCDSTTGGLLQITDPFPATR